MKGQAIWRANIHRHGPYGVGRLKSTTWHISCRQKRAKYRGVYPPVQLPGSDFREAATWSIVSANVGQYALQFIQRVVANHQLAFALLPVLDLHRRAQALGQALFQTTDVRVAFDRCFDLRFAVQPLAYQGLGLPYGQPSCDNVSRPFDLLFRRQTEQRSEER